jgi:hypothetical protein
MFWELHFEVLAEMLIEYAFFMNCPLFCPIKKKSTIDQYFYINIFNINFKEILQRLPSCYMHADWRSSFRQHGTGYQTL